MTQTPKTARKTRTAASSGSVLTQLIPMALLALAFVGVGVFHVTARVMVVDAGYRLSKMESQNRALIRENDTLKLELATLKSPARLEKLARTELGMAPPSSGAVLSATRVQARKPPRETLMTQRRPERIANP